MFQSFLANWRNRPQVVSAAARGRRQSDECGLFDGDATRCADYWNGQRPPLIVISLDGFRR